jgi:hypothetical protein
MVDLEQTRPVGSEIWRTVEPERWRPVGPERWRPVGPERWRPVGPEGWRPDWSVITLPSQASYIRWLQGPSQGIIRTVANHVKNKKNNWKAYCITFVCKE